jgi:hypothetical protein
MKKNSFSLSLALALALSFLFSLYVDFLFLISTSFLHSILDAKINRWHRIGIDLPSLIARGRECVCFVVGLDFRICRRQIYQVVRVGCVVFELIQSKHLLSVCAPNECNFGLAANVEEGGKQCRIQLTRSVFLFFLGAWQIPVFVVFWGFLKIYS